MTEQRPKTVFAMNRMNRLVIRAGGTTIRLVLPNGEPVANAPFTLTKEDGEQVKGTLNENGEYRLKSAEAQNAVIVFDQGAVMPEDQYQEWQQSQQQSSTEAP